MDINAQVSLFQKWTNEQQSELDAQIKCVQIDLKKKSILKRLDDLEYQEELLTFFEKKDEIVETYADKGFPEENPVDIPIEPDESQFAYRAERHFKPWPKYMNRPKPDPYEEKVKKDNLDSLTSIYLHNAKAQTMVANKMFTKKKK